MAQHDLDLSNPPSPSASNERPGFTPPALGPEEWEPEEPKFLVTWKRLLPQTRRCRFEEALRRLNALREVVNRPTDESERKAVARVVTWAHRSSYRRWQTRFRRLGFQGLLNWRAAPASSMPDVVRAAICTLVRADPGISVQAVVAHVKQFHEFETSETTVKRVLREEGLNRPRGPRPGKGEVAEERLELGGAKLLEAAAVETGYLAALSKGVVEHAKGLERPVEALPRDTDDRDAQGRFLSSYNERFRKQPDDEIGPGFASVSVKRQFKDPDHLQIVHVRPETIERKLMALWYSPLLGGGRWDGIRVPRGQLLEELCGYAYMPPTLERFTTELKYAGVSNTLWEIHARLWLEQTSDWGDGRLAGVLFVDGTTKPVWTRLFAESTKVSGVGRTMPGLETVAFHSGYGVPLEMFTHSGRAPLVRVVPGALARVEATWGGTSVGRIVVIDAEGNAVPFLKGLEADGRGFVTRIRPSLMKGKRIFNRNNFRPYRNGDRARSGMADFNDPGADKDAKVKTFRMRVVEVERRGKGDLVYLGASYRFLREQDWKPQDVADLYFSRWPAQEANFRAVNQALGLKEVHGYGKELVANVSVVTKLDKLEQKTGRAEERLKAQEQRATALDERLRQEERELAQRRRRQKTVRRQVEQRVEAGRTGLKSTEKLILEQGQLGREVGERMEKVAKRRQQFDEAEAKTERTKKRLVRYEEEREVLEERRTIFAHDVELDSLFSLLKVGMLMLVSVVLRKYLGATKMAPVTFLERVATLPARLLKTPQLEIVTFDYNTRDPEVMGLLRGSCERINALGLRTRSGRRLEIRVDPPPKPRRPPPPGSRGGSGDRFR